MENNGNTTNDKKVVNKVRSFNGPPIMKFVNEPMKRKSYNVNGAVRSLDLALGRLKKSKLVNGECRSIGADGPSSMLINATNNSDLFNRGMENSSLMSMNFSHYELLRNLSRSNCNSDGGFSGNTCNVTNADLNLKDEHLERYFRSIEMWSRNYRIGATSSIDVDMFEK